MLDRATALPRWLWREIAGLAELFSDVGHGPRRWREGSRIDDPYAGSGPDAPPGTLTDANDLGDTDERGVMP